MPDQTSPDLLIPSIPASQALRAQQQQSPNSQQSSLATTATATSQKSGYVSTGLSKLDDAISSSAGTLPGREEKERERGFARGSVSEVYGPPGVGKTLLLLNTAVNALVAGQHVVWIDTSSPLPKPRLSSFLLNYSKQKGEAEAEAEAEEAAKKLTYIHTPSLPHLLALLTHPPPPTSTSTSSSSFPPKGTSLLVIDSISAPFQSYFPHATEIRTQNPLPPSAGANNNKKESQHTQFLLNRKRSIASHLASAVTKLAFTHNIAVVLINQTHTKIKGLPRPTLFPALATGGAWEMGIGTRIVLYRDFDQTQKKKGKVRWAEMMKKGGKVLAARSEGDVVRFVVEDEDGLREVLAPQAEVFSMPAVSVSVRKRKVGEIADSEEEEEEEEFEDEFGEETDIDS